MKTIAPNSLRLLLLALLTLTVYSAQAQTPFAADGFRIDVPAGFTHTTEGQGNHIFKHTDGYSNYNVLSMAGAGDITTFMSIYPKMLPQTDLKPITKSGGPATLRADVLERMGADEGSYAAFQFEEYGITMHQRVIALRKGTHLYVLADKCPRAEAYELHDLFAVFEDSFRITQ